MDCKIRHESPKQPLPLSFAFPFGSPSISSDLLHKWCPAHNIVTNTKQLHIIFHARIFHARKSQRRDSDHFCDHQHNTLRYFLAALAALYPPWSLTHSLTDSLTVLNSASEFRPNHTKPTWHIYATYFPDPPEVPGHLTYPPTWPTYPSVLPT